METCNQGRSFDDRPQNGPPVSDWDRGVSVKQSERFGIQPPTVPPFVLQRRGSPAAVMRAYDDDLSHSTVFFFRLS